jgi:hypothetical protein
MASNDDMRKITAASYGMSFKMKILLFAIVIVLAAGVTITSIGIFENNASFIKNCVYTDETIQTAVTINNMEEAQSLLGNYTNTTELIYEKYPLEYKCTNRQYFFANKRTGEQFYVCKNGVLIRSVSTNCGYNYNFTPMTEAPQVFSNIKAP